MVFVVLPAKLSWNQQPLPGPEQVTRFTQPFRIGVVDNFLTEGFARELAASWPSQDDSAWHSGHTNVRGKKNPLEQGMRGISNTDSMPINIAKIVKSFHTNEFCAWVERLTGLTGLLPDRSMRWTGMREMLPGSFQLIHSDARVSPESGLRKEVTVLFYLQMDYRAEKNSGDLEIWDDQMDECRLSIAPHFNRCVMFENSDTSFHGVPSVDFNRRALTFSLLSKVRNEGARSKALFVGRPSDPSLITQMGLQRAAMPDSPKWKAKV